MDTGLAVGAGNRQTATVALRMAELAGLVAVIWGLAASIWWLPLIGVMVICASYAAYRRRYGKAAGGSDGGVGDTDRDGGGDGDGGGVGGGGD